MIRITDGLRRVAGSIKSITGTASALVTFALTMAGTTPALAAVPPFYPDTLAFDASEALRRQTATATALGMPVLDTIWLADTVPMEMRLCPAGRFRSGSPNGEPGHEGDETPIVGTIDQPFYLSTTALTERQYMAIMGSMTPPLVKISHYWGIYDTVFSGTYRPDYTARVEFWHMQNSLLPAMQRSALPGWRFACVTSLQMEYATRAGTLTEWYTGNDEATFATSAWYIANSDNVEHPVGQKIPNAWGFNDMLGNAWQWITAFRDTSLHYDTRSGTMHAVKGGAYWDVAGGNGCRSGNVCVQEVPSGVRVAMNCTSDLMNPTSIVPANNRTIPQSKGISIAGDRIILNQPLGAPGLIEFISLDGKKTQLSLEAGLQRSQTIRFRDLGLTPGTYLMRVTQGQSSIVRTLNVQ